MSPAPTPPSAWLLEKSVSLWQQLKDKIEADPSLADDEYVISRYLPNPDGGLALPHPAVLLKRLIDAAIWSDRRADEADNLRKRYTSRRDRYATRTEAIRTTIVELMAALNVQAAEGEEGAASMRKRPASVVITDLDKVEKQDPTLVKVEKTARLTPIGAKLKAGEKVEGAELSNPQIGLTIQPF